MKGREKLVNPGSKDDSWSDQSHLRGRALPAQRRCHGLGRRIAIDDVARHSSWAKVEEGCFGAHDALVLLCPRRFASKLNTRIRHADLIMINDTAARHAHTVIKRFC